METMMTMTAPPKLEDGGRIGFVDAEKVLIVVVTIRCAVVVKILS